MSRKFNYYDLRTGRKCWRSQVDFSDDFFRTDEEREVASEADNYGVSSHKQIRFN